MIIEHRSRAAALAGLLVLAATSSNAEVRSFQNPQHQGYRLDYCQSFGQVCGERVATQWCRGQGYEYASDWAVDNDIGELISTIRLDDERICREFQCDGFASITCGREGRTIRLPNLGAATRATVLTPDLRGTAPAIMPVEVQVLVPGCFQTEPGILLCGTIHEYQHCRTLFAAGKVLGCRAGLAFDGAFANPVAAQPEAYALTLRSSASAAVDRGRRGEGRLRGEAEYSVSFSVPENGGVSETCLQRDRYVYHPTGPTGGSSEIGETAACDEPIAGTFEPHEDDLLAAYDLCEARQAWGTEIEGAIELMAAGLFYLETRTASASGPATSPARIVAPHVTIRAPLSIDCRD
jgi:hypothetical protein